MKNRHDPVTAKMILYGRAHCSHCEQLKFALDLLNSSRASDRQTAYEYVDVDTDAKLQENYGLRVPVWVCGTEVICEGVFDIETLELGIAKALQATN